MIDKILDLFFPPKCAFCSTVLKSKAPVCDGCMSALPFISGKACRICGRPLSEYSYHTCCYCRSEKRYFKHSFVPLLHKDSARKAVIKLKYYSHPYYAKALAYLIADKILSSPYYTKFDSITCVPRSLASIYKDGYNQSELIAKELSVLLDIPFTDTLCRNNSGKNQAALSRQERKSNVKECFVPGKRTFDGGTVLLTDDVYTTGYTANYCSKLLLEMGFDSVYLAMAVIRSDE